MKNLISCLIRVIFILLYCQVSLAEGGIRLNQLDIEGGKGDDERLTRFNASFYSEVINNNYLQLEFSRTEFEDVGMNELTAYFIHRNNNNMLAVGYKRQELSVFKSNHAIVQYQFYQDDLLTVVSTLGYEDKKFNDDHSYGSLYLRLYPDKNLMLQTGPRFNDTFRGDFGSEDIELDLYVEWQPNVDILSGFSVYYEENIFDDKVVGVRFRLEKESLLQLHRTGGILGI